MDTPKLHPYLFRPGVRADAEAMYRLQIACEAVDRRGPIDSLEECYGTFDDPVYDPPQNSLFAFTPQGELAAFAFVYSPPVADTEYVAHLWGEVHPDHRGRGLGSALLQWMESRGRQILTSHADGKPRALRVSTFDLLHDRIALLEDFGFCHIRSIYRMRRDLKEPIPASELPAGLRLETWSPERDPAMMDAFNESFHDHWGFIPVNQAVWRQWFTGGANFRPQFTTLAMDGEQVAAFCLSEEREEECRLSGVREGWVRDLGTRRPWRQRGVATALLLRALHDFAAAGYDFAGLGVDTENLTGALRIYERLGFRVINRILVYSKDV